MKTRRIPERMCVGCKTMKPKRELIRIVRTPEGEVHLDSTGKKAGRGAYICPDVECLQLSLKGDRLQRALSTKIGPELAEQLRASISGSEIE